MALFGGFVGAHFVVLLTHPLEVVKVELQSTQHFSPVHDQFPYRGSIDCAIKLLRGQAGGGKKRSGIRALYTGVAAPLMGIGPSNAVLFGAYSVSTNYFARRNGLYDPDLDISAKLQNTAELTVSENMICAAAAACASSCVMTPFELVKVRLISQQFFRPREYYGALDCARKLFNEGGLPKLYRGWAATIIRDVPGAVAYFGCYGLSRQLLPQDPNKINTASILFAGGVAGAAQWTLIYPLDVVKTHVQLQKEEIRRDWLQTWRYIYMRGGLAAFYVGIGPAVTIGALKNSCFFLGVEAWSVAKHYVIGDDDEEDDDPVIAPKGDSDPF